MCGIAGYQGKFSSELILQMRNIIRHRGPDDDGIYRDEGAGIALAHTRLSIIDLSPLGHQPMVSDHENIVLTFNGEIYNYRELRIDLEQRGVIFRGHSDTEVILRLYELDGEATFARLNGIFALALWDKRDRKLRIVRDGLGVKPLYYANTSEGFIFSSEIKAVLQCESVSRELDAAAIYQTIGYLWTPGPSTCLKAVKKLEPGTLLRIEQNGSITEEAFYKIPVGQADPTMRFEEAVSITREYLQKAVERQLVADVPVGSFLSGGLDSSAIVAYAVQKQGATACYTIRSNSGTEDGTVDDLPYARKVAKQFNCPLEIIDVQPDIFRDLGKMIWFLDEPQADFSALNVYYISQVARQQNIKVLLSGAGGDDLFTGYRRHSAINYGQYFELLPMFLRHLGPKIGQVLPKQGLARRLSKLLSELPYSENQRIASYFLWSRPDRLMGLFNPDFLQSIDFTNVFDPFVNTLNHLGNDLHPVEKCLYLEQKYFLIDHNLNFTDKLSMATGVEVRVPFLDYELVNAAARIPIHFKQKGTVGKFVLKKAMQDILPYEVIWRPKSGFAGAPVRSWIRNELSVFVDELLSPDNLRKRGIFNTQQVSRFIQDDRQGKIDGGYVILALMSLEIWCRQYIDQKSPGLVSLF
jgi:asparagine synthase (glutamine-hydrolysing)